LPFVDLSGYDDYSGYVAYTSLYNSFITGSNPPVMNQWANYNGMITGTQQGYANPQGATQRIHATKILYGFGKACNIGNFE